MKVLVTGFEPFGGDDENPSYEAVKLLPEHICGAEIVKAELPTAFKRAETALRERIEAHRPDIVICTGVAGGSSGTRLERVAINLRDARIEDNDGEMPADEQIVPGGPAAYFTRLPTRKILSALTENGIPAALSYSAGTYVCNDVMYTLLHLAETEYHGVRGGFIHVPYSPAVAAKKQPLPPSLAVETAARALKLAISVTVAE